MVDFSTLQDPSSVLFKILREGVDNNKFKELLPLFIYKGIVTEIDSIGLKFDEINPQWSIKVKTFFPIKLTEEKILYPSSDYDILPLSVGEVVRFVFEDENLTRGIWIGRIPIGNKEKVLARDYYKKDQGDRNDVAIKVFGDLIETEEKITDAKILSETMNYENVEKEAEGSEDRRIYGRTDGIILKKDGSFELGEDAVIKAILGDNLKEYLTGVNGKLVTTQKSLELLLPVIEAIGKLIELIILLGKPEATPLVAIIENQLTELKKNIPEIGKEGSYLSEVVRLK